MKKSIKAILSVVLILVLGSTVFTACGTKHKHEFSEAWTYDETGHWHACTGENCDETEGFETHVYDNTLMRPVMCAALNGLCSL